MEPAVAIPYEGASSYIRNLLCDIMRTPRNRPVRISHTEFVEFVYEYCYHAQFASFGVDLNRPLPMSEDEEQLRPNNLIIMTDSHARERQAS